MRISTCFAIALAVTALTPRASGAQQPADFVQDLDSPVWQVRSHAISELNQLPIANLPPTFADKAIALLEREAVSPEPDDPEALEGYGEYLIALVKGVLRLNDSRALRGMARLGITVNRAAQEFVASRGAAALAFLDEAWQDETLRQSVAMTWGRMIGSFGSQLAPADRSAVIRKILDANSDQRLGFAWAVDLANLTIGLPVLDNIASTDESGIVRGRATSVSNRLKVVEATLAPAARLEALSDALNALCLGASGARADACGALSSMLTQALTQLSTNAAAARDALVSFANTVDVGTEQGIWTAYERLLLGVNAADLAVDLVVTVFLRGTGATANPPTLSLSSEAPSATEPRYKDSPGTAMSGGNAWKEIGTWPAAPSLSNGSLSTLANAHVWLGLKNSDDIGTNFDVRLEVAKNGSVVASGQALCVQGVTRNPDLAKDVSVPFGALTATAFNGTSDVLTLKVLVRNGTNGSGASCGGHSNSTGIRLYFDAASRTSRFDAKF